MMINLRGTGGSGKSTIVRKVMESFTSRTPAFQTSRRQPISYLLQRNGVPDLRVLGHYETACGGCDTITSPDRVYELIEESYRAGENVLFEGIIIGDDVRRLVELHRKTKVKVIALNTPMADCLAGIQARRDERGDERPLDPKNTVSRNERLKKIMSRLRDSNVDATWMNRADALFTCLHELGLMTQVTEEERTV